LNSRLDKKEERMKTHHLAKYFPLLEGEEFDLLVKDIEENGQLEPIVMVGDEILDGVNRWRACEELGIPPWVTSYDGDNPLSYVISLNIRRRHLSISQKSMLATNMLPEFEAEAEKVRLANLKQNRNDQTTISEVGLSRERAAKQFGVSGPSVQRAKRIKEEAPEKAEAIIRGEETVYGVDSELRKAEAEKIAQENKEKGITKEKEKRESREYKAYLEATKSYKHELEIAISYANDGLLPPESQGFITKRHGEIYELMAKLEDTYGC